MANPTITNVGRNGLTNYYSASNSGNANATTGVTQQVRIYGIDAVDGPNGRFTYEEMFDAINNYSGAGGGANFTNRITDSETNNLTEFGRPTRVFKWSGHPGGEASAFCLRSGTLFHEIPGSTIIKPQQNEFIINPMTCPALYPASEGSASTIEEAQPVYDSEFRGNHEIMLGKVMWYSNPDRAFQIGGDAIRAADLGDSTKGAGRSPARLLYAQICPGPNQRLTVTDNRLVMITPDRSGQDRADWDFYGSGIIDMSCRIEDRRVGNDFFHNANFNPNSNIRVETTEDFEFTQNGETIDLRRKFAGVEPFTTLAGQASHVYLDADNLRTTAAIDFTHTTFNGTLGQFQAAFVGANRFNNSTSRAGIVLQGIKATSHRYWTATFNASDVTDVLHLDPATQFTTDNTPFNMAQSNQADRRKDTVMVRSVGVNNQDSDGNGKASVGYVVGYQRTDSDAIRPYRSTWLQSVVPAVDTDGTWSSRKVDRTAAGNANVMGRGVHYLHDATWHDNTQGNAANNYTRYTDSDNATYLFHNGGITRIQQNISLRTTPWDFNSVGSTGIVYNNQMDDIPGVTDNFLAMFQAGLRGQATATQTYAANETANITFDGFTNLTVVEVEGMVGASVIAGTGIATINSATRVSATSVRLNVTTTNTFTLTNDGNIDIQHRGYTWSMSNSTGNIFVIPSGSATMTYTAFAALLAAKPLYIAERRHADQGDTDAAFTSATHDPTVAESSTLIDTYLRRISIPTTDDLSYITNTKTAGRVNLTRIGLTITGSNTLTLNPDSVTNHLNFGSDFTVPAGVVINGTYTDSTGTPSIIDIVAPAGVDLDSDVNFSIAYQSAATIAASVPDTALGDTDVTITNQISPGSGEWKAWRIQSDNTLNSAGVLPATWDWRVAATDRLGIGFGSDLSAADQQVIQTWANDATQNRYIRVYGDSDNAAIFPVVGTFTDGISGYVLLDVDPAATEVGVPQTSMDFHVSVDSDGNNVNIGSADEWRISIRPTITTISGRSFLNINSTNAENAPGNDSDTWYLGISGNRTLDSRTQFMGANSTTINLTADPQRPAGSSSATGIIEVVSFSIDSDSDTGTILDSDSDFPLTYIENADRIGVRFNGYDTGAGGSASTQIDFLDHIKNTPIYADFVAAYGLQTTNEVTSAGVNLLTNRYRINCTATSNVAYMFVESSIPSDQQFYTLLTTGQRCFFSAPDYDPSLVGLEVRNVVNPQLQILADRQGTSSLGIPLPAVDLDA